MINLASNNYLGLASHPRHEPGGRRRGRSELGAGSGAVRTIAGTMTMHRELEERFAAFKHAEVGPDVPVRVHRERRHGGRDPVARRT